MKEYYLFYHNRETGHEGVMWMQSLADADTVFGYFFMGVESLNPTTTFTLVEL